MNRKITLSRYYRGGFLFLLMLAFTSTQAASNPTYDEVEWIELMPKSDLDALLDPPDFLVEIKDGSELDSVEALSGMKQKSENAERFEQALTSTRIIQSFDKKQVRIPGFIVPLSSDEQRRVVEFFIVPYFGACLHMPPPPPNQMIHGRFKEGIKVTQLDVAFWFEGTINIETTSNDTGTSAYAMTLDNIEVYE
ncbi:DUF3299 domain-containing protein [Aliiglaciecola sp. 3_MG-2023]|uniref:DUF3299 domain-containing protein n=1 Tax=Aliiglaciecola sp. 3_MG-2023 TaxID=3062644 RepID=UPI0026E3F44C|nr:DUF3299 domain-containing protein [Aliiglaciecola sp. 3_MG-2023]MDO6694627.1 DUF3299 domain-containing protein [Aliiglaciecola sp. 3_MG-2023]